MNQLRLSLFESTNHFFPPQTVMRVKLRSGVCTTTSLSGRLHFFFESSNINLHYSLFQSQR